MPLRPATPVLRVDPSKMHQVDIDNVESLHGIWTVPVFSTCADYMAEGRRLENLTWRLWTRETFCVEKPALSSVKDGRTLPFDGAGDTCGNRFMTTAIVGAAIAPKNVSPPKFKPSGADSPAQGPLPEVPPLSSSPGSIASDSDAEQRKDEADTVTKIRGGEIQNLNKHGNTAHTPENRRHITPKRLEKMVCTIQEKNDLEPLLHPTGSSSSYSAKNTSTMASTTSKTGTSNSNSPRIRNPSPFSQSSATRKQQLPDGASFSPSVKTSPRRNTGSQRPGNASTGTASVATKKHGNYIPSMQDMVCNFSPYDFSPSTVAREAFVRSKSHSQLQRQVVSAGLPPNRFASVGDLPSSGDVDDEDGKAVVRGFEPGRVSSYRSCTRLAGNQTQDGFSGQVEFAENGGDCHSASQRSGASYATSATMPRVVHDVSKQNRAQGQMGPRRTKKSSFSFGASSVDEEEHPAPVPRPIGQDQSSTADCAQINQHSAEHRIPGVRGKQDGRIAEPSSFNSVSTAADSDYFDDDDDAIYDSDWDDQSVPNAHIGYNVNTVSSPIQRYKEEQGEEQLQQSSMATSPSLAQQPQVERPVQLTRQKSLLTMLINQAVTFNMQRASLLSPVGHDPTTQVVPPQGPRTGLLLDRPVVSTHTHSQHVVPVIPQQNGNCVNNAPESYAPKQFPVRPAAHHLKPQLEIPHAPTPNTEPIQRTGLASQMPVPSMALCQAPVVNGLALMSSFADPARPLSPRTTRRNMLKTEMTQSLRDQILNERLHIFEH